MNKVDRNSLEAASEDKVGAIGAMKPAVSRNKFDSSVVLKRLSDGSKMKWAKIVILEDHERKWRRTVKLVKLRPSRMGFLSLCG